VRPVVTSPSFISEGKKLEMDARPDAVEVVVAEAIE